MTYNPAVNDRSAEILTSANNQAAAIQLRGMENLGNSLSEIGKSYGDAFYKNAAAARENAAKADTNLGTAEAIDSIYGTYGSPEQRQTFREGLNKMSGNQDKSSGFLAMHVQTANALVDLNRSKQMQQAQIDGYKDLYDYKAANSAPAAPKMNAENIRSMVSEAKTQGFSDDAIKAKLQSQYGDWAVNSVYPSKNQTIWMGQ